MMAFAPDAWPEGKGPLDRLGTVAIIGVGLIGGSIGMALRTKGRALCVVGVGRDPAALDEAERLGAVDLATTDLARAMGEADVVVIGTPVARVAVDAIAAARHGGEHLLITDAGSTKRRIVAEVEADERGRATFVGGHPIAGSEKKGAAHARADLCDGRICVLTPTRLTPPDRLERARAFWGLVGCHVLEMTPEEHDEVLASTSHLPHAVAAALAGAVPTEWLSLAAGAYRDGTRVAGSSAELWTSIFLDNKASVLGSLEAFQSQLDRFRDALHAGDRDALLSWWEAARARRERFPDLMTPP
jgi:prephenate dehydrogenase